MQSTSHTGITAKTRDTLARILDHVLKDECQLSATTRDYRWSLTGPNLYSLHRLFDEQRRQLDLWREKVVERAAAFGFPLRGGNRAVAEAEVASSARRPAGSLIGDLLARHEAMAQRLREDIARLADPATADLLTHLVEFHETTAWMLRMVQSGPDSDRLAREA